jgi:hypothetical protein
MNLIVVLWPRPTFPSIQRSQRTFSTLKSAHTIPPHRLLGPLLSPLASTSGPRLSCYTNVIIRLSSGRLVFASELYACRLCTRSPVHQCFCNVCRTHLLASTCHTYGTFSVGPPGERDECPRTCTVSSRVYRPFSCSHIHVRACARMFYSNPTDRQTGCGFY